MITKKELIRKGFKSSTTLKEEDEKNTSKGNTDFSEMVSLLLQSQTQVHILHLQCDSYSEHKALQGYYEGIDALVDGLIESFQGKYGIVKGYKSNDLVEWSSTGETIKYMDDLCNEVENLRDCCDDSYIQNQIDTICELIKSTVYKLKFLK